MTGFKLCWYLLAIREVVTHLSVPYWTPILTWSSLTSLTSLENGKCGMLPTEASISCLTSCSWTRNRKLMLVTGRLQFNIVTPIMYQDSGRGRTTWTFWYESFFNFFQSVKRYSCWLTLTFVRVEPCIIQHSRNQKAGTTITENQTICCKSFPESECSISWELSIPLTLMCTEQLTLLTGQGVLFLLQHCELCGL